MSITRPDISEALSNGWSKDNLRIYLIRLMDGMLDKAVELQESAVKTSYTVQPIDFKIQQEGDEIMTITPRFCVEEAKKR
jgi:hypothetical protein